MATNCENRQSLNGRVHSSKGPSPSMMTSATSDPLASGHANIVNPTVQQAKPQVIVRYCHVCKREFGSDNGMQNHLATSKDHRARLNHNARVKRQTSSSTQANHSSKRADRKDKTLFSTVIPSPQQSAELELLSKHSHTSEHLLKHGYQLCLYTADDLAGLSRCKNCKGVYWAIILIPEIHLTHCSFAEAFNNTIPI